ncbi:xylulokinase [Arachnia propionica]|uniref:Xylulose kinase n=1 Tax=Arachnia propionica TaxID=1750 RepID=A0A3P1WX25_9ACTN|nr:xylulokinase [Arachnia propionica]RRD49970.1 xylulokinase [Arachnia propionica]
MTTVVLGIDSSTQSCTVEARDLDDGSLLATARTPHPPTTPPVSEQDPEAWWQALVAAVRQVMAGRDWQVAGLAVGAQCHGLVLTDEQGRALRPAKLWNDTTSAPQAAALVERYGAAWWAREIGLIPSAALTVTKLAWVAEHEPDLLARGRRLFVPHDWLTFRLTGRHCSDRSDSSGTGYFSADTMTWRTDILTDVLGPRDWEAMLPTVLRADEAAGEVLPEVAAELGITPGAVVGPGGGDQHLAAQGIGLGEGDVAWSLGTSGVIFATVADPVKDTSGGIDGVANTTGGYLPLACTLNCTKVTDAFARLLGVEHAEFARLALAAEPDPDRPVLAAYLDGERSPRLPWATGMLGGLTSAVTREQLALAAVEGVCLGLLRGERALERVTAPIGGRTVLIGGGARSEAYRQVIADLTGRASITVDAPEGTARGAAVQAAAVALGSSVAEQTRRWLPAETTRTEPRADRAAVWDRYLALADVQAEGPVPPSTR